MVKAGSLTAVVLRSGMGFLAAIELALGVVATLAPRSFYDHVPWVSLNPPYSEHLMRDLGAMNLALALVTVVATKTMNPLMIRTSLAAYLAFAIPHLIFHATHHQQYPVAAAITETAGATGAALLPLALLLLTVRKTNDVPHRRISVRSGPDGS
jgi:hypothetical protein